MNTFRGIRILVFFATPGEKGGKEFVSPSSKEEKKKEEKKWYE